MATKKSGKTEAENISERFHEELKRRPQTKKLDRLEKNRSVVITPDQVHSQSKAHQEHTLKLLRLIDQFAVAHAREHGRIEQSELPVKMKKVLEKYAVRSGLSIDANKHGIGVARAFEAHKKRIDLLYSEVEQLKTKHSI